MNSFIGVARRVLWGGLILASLLLSACSRSTVATNHTSAEFSLEELKQSSSLLVVSPEVKLEAFRKPYRQVFKDSGTLNARIVRKLTDSLKIKVVLQGPPDSTVDPTDAKYRIRVVSLIISDSTLEAPRVLLPSGTGTMQPVGGGSSKSCIVRIQVDIENLAGDVVHSFTVKTVTEVPLYAYKSALTNAIDAAVTRVARHLGGKSPAGLIPAKWNSRG